MECQLGGHPNLSRGSRTCQGRKSTPFSLGNRLCIHKGARSVGHDLTAIQEKLQTFGPLAALGGLDTCPDQYDCD